MITTNFGVPTPADFSFAATVHSHGWRELSPFHYDDDRHVLSMPQRLRGGAVVLRLSSPDDHELNVQVESDALLGRDEEETLRGTVRTCFGLDRDLAEFRGFIDDIPGYGWVTQHRLGRLLVSPTVWEDLAKTLATTNTTWGGTISMCRRLVSLGEPAGDGFCFPTPQQVAAVEPERLAEVTKLGYRAAYLHELATKISDGKLDVEAWREGDLTTDELYRQLTALKGFGSYAAGNMLGLMGRHERLAIDSVVRKVFRERMNGGREATDREIETYYERFASWAGLVMWLDVMRTSLVSYLEMGQPRAPRTRTRGPRPAPAVTAARRATPPAPGRS